MSVYIQTSYLNYTQDEKEDLIGLDFRISEKWGISLFHIAFQELTNILWIENMFAFSHLNSNEKNIYIMKWWCSIHIVP